MRFLSIHSINYPEYLLNKAIFSLPIFESQFQTPYVQYLPKTVLYSTVGNKIPSICNTTVNETILEAIVWCSAVSKKCVAGSIWRNMTLGFANPHLGEKNKRGFSETSAAFQFGTGGELSRRSMQCTFPYCRMKVLWSFSLGLARVLDWKSRRAAPIARKQCAQPEPFPTERSTRRVSEKLA